MNSTNGWENLPAYISYSAVGILVGSGNLIIALCILRYEALRSNKEYVMILGLSIADAINMFGFLIAGFHRIYLLYTSHHNDRITPLECVGRIYTIIWSFSLMFANLMLAVISVDRFICVFFPLFYIGLSATYARRFVGTCAVYSMGSGLLGLIMVILNEGAPLVGGRCITGNVLRHSTPALYYHYSNAPKFFALLSVAVYIVVAVGFKWKNHISGAGQASELELKRQSKFTTSLGIGCLCTFCFFVVPNTIAAILYSTISPKFSFILIILWSMANINPLCNLFIYPLRHKEILQALTGLFTWKSMPINIQMWKTNQVAQSAVNMNSARGPTSQKSRARNVPAQEALAEEVNQHEEVVSV